MWIDFVQLPATARVWVFQANRPLTEAEVQQVSAATDAFVRQWTAHQQPLLAGYQVLYRRFLVLGVDESQQKASGCSIDASVHFIRGLEQTLGVQWFDRTLLAYWDEAQQVQTIALAQIKAAIAEGSITPDTIVFSNLVQTKADWEAHWQIPAAQSWVGRYFAAAKA